MKVVSYLMLALLTTAAVLQFNDPDPLLWMVIYGTAALITVLFITGYISTSLVAAAAVTSIGTALVLGFQVLQEGQFFADSLETWQMQNPAEEKAREAGGLLIIGLWMGWMTIRLKGKNRKRNFT